MKRKSIGQSPLQSWIVVGGCAVIGILIIAAMWLLPQYNEDGVWHDVSEQVDTLLTSNMDEVIQEKSGHSDSLLPNKEVEQSTGSNESPAVVAAEKKERTVLNEDGDHLDGKLHGNEQQAQPLNNEEMNSPPDGKTDSNHTVHTEQTSSTKIHVNRASAEELTRLPGIGPSKAEAIVQYREQHGHFQTIEDLDNVKGIGEKMLEKMRPYIELAP